MNNPISFRLPEVQAKELAVVLASSAEWHLATLEQLLTRKSSPKSDIRRQQEICDKLLFHCFELKIKPIGLNGRRCVRLSEKLQELQNDHQDALTNLHKRVAQTHS